MVHAYAIHTYETVLSHIKYNAPLENNTKYSFLNPISFATNSSVYNLKQSLDQNVKHRRHAANDILWRRIYTSGQRLSQNRQGQSSLIYTMIIMMACIL